MMKGIDGIEGERVIGIDALKLSTSRLLENIMARLHALPDVADVAHFNGGVNEAWRDSAKRFVETEMAFEIVLEEYRSWNLRNGLLTGIAAAASLSSSSSSSSSSSFSSSSSKSVAVRLPVGLSGDGVEAAPSTKAAEAILTSSSDGRGYFNINLHDLKGLLDAFMEADPKQRGKLGPVQFTDTLNVCAILRNNSSPIVPEALATAVIETFRSSSDWDENNGEDQISVDYVQFWSQLYERVALVLGGKWSADLINHFLDRNSCAAPDSSANTFDQQTLLMCMESICDPFSLSSSESMSASTSTATARALYQQAYAYEAAQAIANGRAPPLPDRILLSTGPEMLDLGSILGAGEQSNGAPLQGAASNAFAGTLRVGRAPARDTRAAFLEPGKVPDHGWRLPAIEREKPQVVRHDLGVADNSAALASFAAKVAHIWATSEEGIRRDAQRQEGDMDDEDGVDDEADPRRETKRDKNGKKVVVARIKTAEREVIEGDEGPRSPPNIYIQSPFNDDRSSALVADQLGQTSFSPRLRAVSPAISSSPSRWEREGSFGEKGEVLHLQRSRLGDANGVSDTSAAAAGGAHAPSSGRSAASREEKERQKEGGRARKRWVSSLALFHNFNRMQTHQSCRHSLQHVAIQVVHVPSKRHA